ncbi:MAG: hypothetical protein A2284_04735 [Deltaproteobacteria bacterium RIFOXYA12_FULL_61_11]|nr:MAG: hypothetical protein A2284_04735 [Deltaproteobacteria bacterium RIFOXYA12_FULL_61_11]
MVSRKKLILKSLNRVNDLPTISEVYREVLDAIDADQDIEQIAQLAKRDLALSTKVLRVVNSPVFRTGGREVTDIETGVVRLGILEFKKLVISLSVIETFGNFGHRIDYRTFWKHCLTCASVTVKTFALVSGKNLGRKVAGELYTAALLHDIGIIILDHYFPDYYLKVLEAGDNPASRKLLDRELEILEITHEEVGEIVARRWNLPEYILAAIRYHHSIREYQGRYEPIVRVVKIANEMCLMQGVAGVTPEGVHLVLDEEAQEKLKQKSALYEKLLSSFEEDVEKSEAMLSLV